MEHEDWCLVDNSDVEETMQVDQAGDKRDMATDTDDLEQAVDHLSVSCLLADSKCTNATRADAFSRDVRLSMFSELHQRAITGEKKEPTRKLFCAGEFIPESGFCGADPVQPITEERGTQVNLPALEQQTMDRDRCERFASALGRNLSLRNTLQVKAQECERLSIANLRLEQNVAELRKQSQKDQMRLRLQERSLRLARENDKMFQEFNSHLKAERNQAIEHQLRLRQELQFLTGQADLNNISIDKLEELEVTLMNAFDNVRRAIRKQYRQAIDNQRELDDTDSSNCAKDICIVCFQQPVSVMLLPCRHKVLCSFCALRVSSCPIDRQPVEDKILTYGLRAYLEDNQQQHQQEEDQQQPQA